MVNIFGDNIPLLGFGTMRLPQKDGEIDIEAYKEMADMFIERGYTYFDTAYFYHNGKSESAFREAVAFRYPRSAYYLADKMPIYAVKKEGDCEEFFQNQLNRTGAGYFDYYLLHSVQKETYVGSVEKFNICGFCLQKKKEGLIRHFGMSFHDTPEVLEEILSAHPELEFVQLQINYDDWESPKIRARECYEVARKHGKPIIIMEPVKGGSLAELTPALREILSKADPGASPASWAIRFAASLPGVMTVLSGMSNLEQMDDNTTFMSNFKPLSEAERAMLLDIAELIHKTPTIPCTSCKYCLERCPQNIRIPNIIDAVNKHRMYGINRYKRAVGEGNPASQCLECGVCEENCPQHLEIREALKTAVELFE